MFKGYIIEYGSYIVFGLLIAAVSDYCNVDVLVAWLSIAFGMLYNGIVIPLILWLAWGVEH